MPEEQAEKQHFVNIKLPDFKSVYANNVTFSTGPFDFSMTFGDIVEVDQPTLTATVEQRVRVVMSPLHARIFALGLVAQIRAYEQNFGKIVIPPAMITPKPQSQETVTQRESPEGSSK